tara:strand:+ start:575 stop:838 length:264 start_codon:yes stop_codon:yes gene_type:complete
MIQAILAKKAIDMILKKMMNKKEIKKLRKYVEETNELDIKVKDLENENVILAKQINVMSKKINKQGKYIEELEKNVAILSKNSHPHV